MLIRTFVLLTFLLSCSHGPLRTPASVDFSQSDGSCNSSTTHLFQNVTGNKRSELSELVSQRIKNYSPLTHRDETFGIEFEGIMPIDLSDIDIMEAIKPAIAKHFKIDLSDIRIKQDEIRTSLNFLIDGEINHWEIHRELFDVPSGFKNIEFTSSILEIQDLELYYSLLKILKDSGVKQYPRRGGIHVHYGVPHISIDAINIIYKVIADLDSEIRSFYKVSSEREPLGKIDNIALNIIGRLQGKQILGNISAIKAKKLIRYAPIFKTLEFRMLGSSLDPEEVRHVVEFTKEFIYKVLSKDEKLINYLTESEKISFHGLLKVLNLETKK